MTSGVSTSEYPAPALSGVRMEVAGDRRFCGVAKAINQEKRRKNADSMSLCAKLGIL